MGNNGIPNYYGRQLVRTIRRLREQCELTQEEAGAKLHLSLQKLSRIENGQLPGYHELRAMLKLYGLPQSGWDPCFRLWERAKQRGWWRKFGVPDTTYICMEQEASRMTEFALGRLPELLQTEGYARRAAQCGFPGDEAAADGAVKVQLRRQDRLFRDEEQLTLHVLLHEPALYQGGDREQWIELYQRAQLPNITVQVIEQRAGLHSGLDGPVALLEFDDPEEPDIVFAGSVLGLSSTQDEERTAAVRARLERLTELALSPEDTLAALRGLIG
ncbi:helix-turn-helix transcriptional regulator [Actinocrispum sp. NPDC049592]|uniref:helix-turn-helix domain-containing protein n=1 Tax=Actinocrispum sp. NPDC049592 TaxID=3154835 RepID=UPI00341ACD85